MASLSASASLIIQTEAKKMWDEKTAAGTQYDNAVTTINKLATSQTLRFMPIMDDAGKCISFKVWWPDLTDTMAAAVYSGSVPDASADCTLETGTGIGTQSLTYSPNAYLYDTVYVADNLCANDVSFGFLASEQLNAAMLKLRIKLNQRSILFLDTNKTANLDATNASYGMTTGATTTIPYNLILDPSILIKFQIQADSNRLPNDFLLMDSTNLLFSEKIAPYLGLNGEGKAHNALYGDIAMRYNSDIRDMATTTGDNSLFLVNKNMFGFFNRTAYTTAPVLINSDRDTRVFKIQDPVLKYRRVDMQGDRVVGSSIVPVEYDVIYQKVCTGNDATGRPYSTHTFKVMFEGGMVLGPTANSGATGILKYSVESGV